MRFVKSVQWLSERLHDDHVRIADCRFALADPLAGRREYEHSHIPGAVYFDLESDLSGPVQKHGGRHPLPNAAQFKSKLEAAGIDQNKTVVVYDNGDGAFAARFWWMLTFLGHQHVYVLDGGYQCWIKEGYPVNDRILKYEKSNFDLRVNEQMLATYEEVKQAVENGNQILIDSRASSRYLGLEEPIDREPGHIPGAINKVWTDSLELGKWKSRGEQKQRFQDLQTDDEIIVYCGSGVTATPNILALLEAGFANVKLYAGSYSDWVSYPDNKVDKG